ncbi:MAG: phospholipase D-like domain-containing protein [Pseudomonadota bacterium]
MQTQAYFDDIQLHILYELRKATTSIHIAVAWFTDPEIFEQLCQKAGSGVRVELIVVNDSINRKSGIEHERLRNLGGVFMMVGDKKKSSAIMHNKFCVIDGATVITGSYNWSRQAQQNSENITIISDHPELARQFIQEFESIFERHSGKGVVGADLGKIVARLEALRLVIELDDEDDIELHLNKLKKLLSGGDEYAEVNEIIARIEMDQLDQATNYIETFVRSRKQIAVYLDPDIPELTLELKTMEIQVGALEDEKTELEKLLHIYNYRHAAEVGEIIRRILLLRRDQLKGEAKQDESKEDEYQEARKDYEEYDRDYQETSMKELFKITEAEQQELKATFRACSKMCHPDVVALEFKGEATIMFAKLSEANEKNDIAAVKAIYEQLQKGIFAPMSATVSDAQKLHKQVVRMRGKVKDLAVAIFTIRSSEAYRKVVAIKDWDEYFARLKEQLQTELDRLEAVTE